MIFGISSQALLGQLLLGLINGAFYALLSLGLAVIFGMLNIINFAHGALYMMGAFVAYFLLNLAGIGYWPALIIAPLIVGAFGVVIEKGFISPVRSVLYTLAVLAFLGAGYALAVNDITVFNQYSFGFSFLPWIYKLATWLIVGFCLYVVAERATRPKAGPDDHLYGLLLTFGIALIIQGLFQNYFGSSGLPYSIPPSLSGGRNLGFMFLPNYRAWVIVFSLVVCLATWFVIEKTKIGAYLRAATENPTIVRAFGVNVPLMITLTYGFGVALAALAGVLAAPINQVRPLMGADFIIVVFAVVVIGGMGSIMGSIVTGFMLGLIEGLTKVFYPEASNTVVFVIMAIVLLIKPAGLFGRTA